MDLYALDKRHERQSPLLTIDSRIPKLVARVRIPSPAPCFNDLAEICPYCQTT